MWNIFARGQRARHFLDIGFDYGGAGCRTCVYSDVLGFWLAQSNACSN